MFQLGFGAAGSVDENNLEGNQWCGATDDVATAVLLYENGSASVDHNKINGNSDIGIYVGGNNTSVSHNNARDQGPGCNVNGYDVGIGNYGDDRAAAPATDDVNHSTVGGFDTAFDGPLGDHNTVKPTPVH